MLKKLNTPPKNNRSFLFTPKKAEHRAQGMKPLDVEGFEESAASGASWAGLVSQVDECCLQGSRWL